MMKFLYKIWRIMPEWMQELAGNIIRPRFQVGVGAMVFNDQGKLLLCEHTYRRIHPWGLPGGDLKFGEDPKDGIKRELNEETGLVINQARLILVENSSLQKHLTLIYLCQGVQGEFQPSDEVARIEYFDPDKLPEFVPMQKTTIDRALAIIKSEGSLKQ